jgi:small subunit ribosomal protein S13
MPRIAGVNIPENKQIETSLTYIYGVGLPLAKKILKQTKIDPFIKASELKPEQINELKEIIEKKYKIEGELHKYIMISVKRLRDINCWKGARHIKGLPVRGQRTKTNSRTVRGNVRRTVGSGRHAAPSPK